MFPTGTIPKRRDCETVEPLHNSKDQIFELVNQKRTSRRATENKHYLQNFDNDEIILKVVTGREKSSQKINKNLQYQDQLNPILQKNQKISFEIEFRNNLREIVESDKIKYSIECLQEKSKVFKFANVDESPFCIPPRHYQRKKCLGEVDKTIYLPNKVPIDKFEGKKKSVASKTLAVSLDDSFKTPHKNSNFSFGSVQEKPPLKNVLDSFKKLYKNLPRPTTESSSRPNIKKNSEAHTNVVQRLRRKLSIWKLEDKRS